MIWSDAGLTPLHYRLLWWLVDMGAIAGTVQRGWQKVCASDLGVHRVTLRRATLVLISKKFLRQGEKRGTVAFEAGAFESFVDQSRVKVVREGAGECAESR